MQDQLDFFATPLPAPARPPAPAAVGPRGNILVGTCSWTDPSLIKSKRFYPRGTSSAEARLRYYASQFPIVEVDSSYFAMPSASNAAAWVARTPPDFRFNLKAFRLFTGHQTPPEAFPADLRPLLPAPKGRSKNLYYPDVPLVLVDEMWRRFLLAVEPLAQAGKLLAVHFQFAPWVSSTPERVAHVEHCVQRMAGHRVAVEFRNQSWLGPERVASTMAWEQALGVVHTVVDEPTTGNFTQAVWRVAEPSLVVVRLHGRNADTWAAKGLTASSDRFDYEYTEDELQDLADRILALATSAFQVVVLLNVNMEDQGIRAARRLLEIMGRLTPEAVFER